MIKCTWSGENSFIAGNPWQLSSKSPKYESVHWYCGVWFVRGISNAPPDEKKFLLTLFRGKIKHQGKRRVVRVESTLAWAFTEPIAAYKIVRSGKFYYLRVFSTNGKESYFIRSTEYEIINECLFKTTGKKVREEVVKIMGGTLFLAYDANQRSDLGHRVRELRESAEGLVEMCHKLIEEGGSEGLAMASKLFEAVGTINDVADMYTPSIE